MHITINLPSDSRSQSHIVTVEETAEDFAYLTLDGPPSPSASPSPVFEAASDAWAALYPLPDDIELDGKPWVPGPHKNITLTSQ